MRLRCNRRPWMQGSSGWFTRIPRSSISRPQAGRSSGLSRTPPVEAEKKRQSRMEENAFSIQSFEARRVRVESARSFEEVLLNLQQGVGNTTIPQGSPKAQGSVPTREQFEQAIQQEVGESDFTLFFEMNYGHWLPLFGIKQRVVRWILGNPLIAITMIRHDITASLFAPVELLLLENESGNGS